MIPVIIPFYKNHSQLEKCTAHLRAQTLPVEIYVRDNSLDNIQFTAAVNEGFRKYLAAPCTYMITVNQDMYLAPDAVEQMVAFMDSQPQCGIGVPLQISPEDPDIIINAGGTHAFPAGSSYTGPLKDFTTPVPLFWGSATCWIVRKQMMIEIGLLDENLVFIASDSDYCFTARARGWQIWLIPTARGVHECGVAFNLGDPQLQQLKNDDIAYFAAKWLNGDIYKMLDFDNSPTPRTITRAKAWPRTRPLST
jgi:hypothetical protein